jgi:hypothetical protein
MSHPKTVRIINPSTRWLAFGDYQCGVEYEVPADVADALAPRGFVPVAPPAPAPVTPIATPEE